jgi:hypothetical protein
MALTTQFFLLFLVIAPALASNQILDRQMRHLRSGGEAEWDEFKNVPVDGSRLDIEFKAEKNTNEWTLFVRQRDVKVVWPVQLNGKTITNLFLSEDDLVNAIPIPAGALQDGTNKLSIVPPKEQDDIQVGEIRLESRPVAEAISEGGFDIQVTEKRKALPCRVTIVDSAGSLFPARVEAPHAAVRPGVIYLGDGFGAFHLPIGDYTVYVGRGFEYSVSTQRVSIRGSARKSIKVELRREVVTRGYAASDTHVHTFTYSRHGDATDEERAITLAGEGIELPIATDHNLVIDPVTPARKTGMDRCFTPVRGDEVTTGHAHFNIFPVEPDAKPPNWRMNDWPELMKEMRAAPGVKVVILNHPRNIHNHFQPFASTNFNAKTGENLRGFEFTFDAVEAINSSALQSDWMINFRDWMALLNYGCRVTSVGSSDCHDVSRYIVGQGRTYVRCDDSNPAHIDIDRACESFLKGRALVSMGLLADMKVDKKFSVGDLATNLKEQIRVAVDVQGPAWTAVDQVQLYANGELLREEKFAPIYKPGLKRRLEWKIPKQGRDFYLVAIASGPSVSAPFWRIPKPYQPTSTTWNPRVIGATNPIWIDADGDGRFTPLRLQKQIK